MKLAIYDPKPTINDFVEKRYFEPLQQFCHNNGIEAKRITSPIPEAGWTMLCNAWHLNETIVQHFDSCRCPLVAMSCNDSAYLTQPIAPFFHRIPLVFTVSGVQRTKISKRSIMNPDMTVSTENVQFLPDEDWARWEMMRTTGRLLPLPYVPWDRLDDVPIPESKTQKILFRGGCHFWRFVAYLHALKAGVAHPASGFLLRDYFAEDMVPQFRYCEKCRSEWNKYGGQMFYQSGHEGCECTRDLDLNEPLQWNNRSPRAFFYLANAFMAQRSDVVDQASVQVALNFQRQPARDHLRAIADASFYCEAKWQFSIPFPQRYFEAASVGTVYLTPQITTDQEYFPVMNPWEHYAVYGDDFTGLDTVVEMGPMDGIRANAKALYEHWIRPTDYVTNTRLLQHILSKIQEVCGT